MPIVKYFHKLWNFFKQLTVIMSTHKVTAFFGHGGVVLSELFAGVVILLVRG